MIGNKTGKVGLAMTMAAALLVGHTTGVLAAGNGQQLSIHDVNGNAYSVHLAGYNQNGSWVTQNLNMPSAYLDDPGWWWKGSVTIYAYSGFNESGSLLSTTSASVPTSQSSDWYTCQVDGGSSCAAGYHTV